MKHRLGKFGTVFLALALALTLTGAAFAAWTDDLTISGTVTTGDLGWEFTAYSIDDTTHGTATPDNHCNDGFDGWTFWPDPDGKDVAWGEGQLVDGPDGDGDMSQLNLTFHNVYPCYFNSVSVYAANNGSIPMIVEKVVINGIEIFAEPTPVVPLDLDGDGDADVEIWWGDALGEQRHPGEPFPEMSFWFHCLQEAPQGATLNFTIQVVGIQWNEYVAP